MWESIYPKGPKESGLVFKAQRLVYHSTLGLRVIKQRKKGPQVRVSLGHEPSLVARSKKLRGTMRRAAHPS